MLTGTGDLSNYLTLFLAGSSVLLAAAAAGVLGLGLYTSYLQGFFTE